MSASLAGLVRGHAAIQVVGYDKDQAAEKLAGTPSELIEFEEMAGQVVLNMALRLSDLGVLLACADHKDKGIGRETIDGIGWLVSDLGSALAALIEARNLVARGIPSSLQQQRSR